MEEIPGKADRPLKEDTPLPASPVSQEKASPSIISNEESPPPHLTADDEILSAKTLALDISSSTPKTATSMSSKISSPSVDNTETSTPPDVTSVNSSSPSLPAVQDDAASMHQVITTRISPCSPVVGTGSSPQDAKSFYDCTSSPVPDGDASSSYQGVKSGTSSPSVGDTASCHQERDMLTSDGPTSCSTPVSYNDSSESDMHSARGGYVSRPLDLDLEASSHTFMGSTQTFHSAVTFLEQELTVPIVDYEVMEQRAKFTVM